MGGEEDYENPFRPMRIHLETAALDAVRTSTNGPQIDFVKNSILPRMRDYWTSALSVVPVSGNLLISSADLQGRLYCGDTEFSSVPASHMSEGVPDADLVLYVSGVPSARFCGPSTLAVAVACNFDQVRRERFQTQSGGCCFSFAILTWKYVVLTPTNVYVGDVFFFASVNYAFMNSSIDRPPGPSISA